MSTEIISDKVLLGEEGKHFTVVISKEIVVNAVDYNDAKEEIKNFIECYGFRALRIEINEENQ
jgi:hypothetical protein